MIRNVAMLVLCFIVAGAMAGTITWFLRRLKRIEEDMWGEKARMVKEAKKQVDAA